jgi:hypothetical protein
MHPLISLVLIVAYLTEKRERGEEKLYPLCWSTCSDDQNTF